MRRCDYLVCNSIDQIFHLCREKYICLNADNNLFVPRQFVRTRMITCVLCPSGRCFVQCLRLLFFLFAGSFFFISFNNLLNSHSFYLNSCKTFFILNGKIVFSSGRSCSWWQLTNSYKASNWPLLAYPYNI